MRCVVLAARLIHFRSHLVVQDGRENRLGCKVALSEGAREI